MRIVGFEPVDFVNYTGKVCSVLFLPLCNFKCPWCFNKDLVENRVRKDFNLEKQILPRIRELNERTNYVEAVCITGGEPTLNSDLPDLCGRLHEEGLLVKLDTNGTNYEMVTELIEKKLIDYIAVDFKFIPSQYEKAIGRNFSMEDKISLSKTFEQVLKEHVDYEFRTTLIPGLHTPEIIQEMSEYIKYAKRWYFQNFLPNKKYLSSEYETVKPFSKKEIEIFINSARKNIYYIGIRND